MRIAEIMSSPVETIEASESAESASRRMSARGIHHLVVTRGGRPVGILSAKDLSGPRGVALRWAGTAEDLMSDKVVFATPRTTVRDAAHLLRGRNIGSLPVLEGRKVVGIVTITDLIELVARGFGKKRPRPAVRRRSAD